MAQLMIKKMLAILSGCLLAMGLLVSQASATVLPPDCVFTFDKVGLGSNVLGPSLFPPNPTGTMSLTDTGNTIQVAFAGSLTNWNITAIFLNYDFGSGPAIGPTLTYPTATTGVLSNLVQMDGYTSAGLFDMQFSNGGVPLPTSGTLQLNGGATNIDASLFTLPTFNDTYPGFNIYAGLLLDSANLGRRWAFASTVECAPVPEPSTLLLLGGGLAGLAGMTWRRRRNG